MSCADCCDVQSDQGIIWEHELYEPLSYNQDRTFLHTLEGDDFVIAFAFADDGEATELHKKINNRQKYGESSHVTPCLLQLKVSLP